MNIAPVTNLKIKTEDYSQTLKTYAALIKLGYECPQDLPHKHSPFVYAYVNKPALFDYTGKEQSGFDALVAQGAERITFIELMGMVQRVEDQKAIEYEAAMYKQERPLFEKEYKARGGNMEFLAWVEYENGLGHYQPDWDKIVEKDCGKNDPHFAETIELHAGNVDLMLESWVECAKCKIISVDHAVLPLQANADMLISGLAVIAVCNGKEDINKELKLIWSKMAEAYLSNTK